MIVVVIETLNFGQKVARHTDFNIMLVYVAFLGAEQRVVGK